MGSHRYRLQKLRRRRTGWPIATLAAYGPNEVTASKLVASIMATESADPDPIRKWFSKAGDVRTDPDVLGELLAFFEVHGVRRVASVDRILGCPHEEGVDYEGRYCPDPACGFWVGVDRWTGEPEQ